MLNKVDNLKGDKMNITLNTNDSTDAMIQQVLPTLLTAIKSKAFVKDYEASDEEALALIVSKFTKWDGDKILTVASEALEDANFHDLAEKVAIL
ncbi:MAG: hypothetical protein L7S72_09510 [Flavobacteriales bacterium]|nr:hypothetical protein [Flavobacteriales bacterium]